MLLSTTVALLAGGCSEGAPRQATSTSAALTGPDAAVEMTSTSSCAPAEFRPAPPAPPRALPLPDPNVTLNVWEYGARPAQDSRASIQQALDEAATRPEKTTVLVPPAHEPYLLTAAGPNPFAPGNRYALRVHSNTTLFIAQGAALKLAADQQSDAEGPVDLIIFNGEAITVTGGGSIVGNTGGQPRWTGATTLDGERYQQVHGGCLVRGHKPARDILISDLYLQDSFSNPVNIRGDSNIRLRRLRSEATGEGPQVLSARGVVMEDLDHSDFADVSVGDGFELAEVNDFAIRRCRARAAAGGKGTAVDIFGSSFGTVTDVESIGWSEGIEVQDTGAHRLVSDSVSVERLRVETAHLGIRSVGEPQGRVSYREVQLSDVHIGVLVQGERAPSPLSIDALRVQVRDPASLASSQAGYAAILLRGSRALQVSCAVLEGGATSAVVLEGSGTKDTPTLELLDTEVHGFLLYGLDIRGSYGPAAPMIVVQGGDLSAAAGTYHGLPPWASVD